MTQPAIQFYHLLTTPLEQALPQLMEKALEQDMRVVVRGTAEQVKRLDGALWTYNPASWLPHGTQVDPQAERQPIYLTEGEEAPNSPSLLVITDGRTPTSILPLEGGGGEKSEPEGVIYERIFDVFDGGNEDEVIAARARWKCYKERGLSLTYIRQKEDGGWEKVMSTEETT